MKVNYLAIVFPTEGLPQNTVHACGNIWAQTSRMLLPGLGKFYDRFHPAARPWGVEIPAPFSVVLGRDDPCLFLRLYLRARDFQEESIGFHMTRALAEMGIEKLQATDDILVGLVTPDGTNKLQEGHFLWHTAIAHGAILPDCGVYYAEQKQSVVDLDFEENVESTPTDYALSLVTLEQGEDGHGV